MAGELCLNLREPYRLTTEMSPEVGGGTTEAEVGGSGRAETTGATEFVDSPPSDLAL